MWLNDSSRFFYVKLDENHRPLRVKRHLLGTRADGRRADLRGAGSRLLHQSRRNASGRFCSSTASDHETSEHRLLDRADPHRHHGLSSRATTAFNIRCRASRRSAVHPHQRRRRHRFQDRHRASGNAGARHWRDLIAYREGVYIIHVELLPAISCGWSATTPCPPSSCAISQPARSMPSHSMRRRIRSISGRL